MDPMFGPLDGAEKALDPSEVGLDCVTGLTAAAITPERAEPLAWITFGVCDWRDTRTEMIASANAPETMARMAEVRSFMGQAASELAKAEFPPAAGEDDGMERSELRTGRLDVGADVCEVPPEEPPEAVGTAPWNPANMAW